VQQLAVQFVRGTPVLGEQFAVRQPRSHAWRELRVPRRQLNPAGVRGERAAQREPSGASATSVSSRSRT
jgi:hypothetical protein